MRTRIAFVDPSNYALPFDYYHIYELSRFWDVDFYCSTSSLNDFYIDKIKSIPNVRVIQFNLSKKNRFLRIKNYLILNYAILKNSNQYKFIYLQWLLSPVEIIVAMLIKRKLCFGLHNLIPHGYSGLYYLPFKILTRLSSAVVTYSSYVLNEAETIYKIPKEKLFLFQHGYISSNQVGDSKSIDPDFFKALSSSPKLAFIGSVKKYKGLDRVLVGENKEFLKKEFFVVYGKFIDDKNNYITTLDDFDLKYCDDYFDDSIFKKLKSRRTIIVIPYYDISQSGFMYTLSGSQIPFIATGVGDVRDFLHFIGMQEAIFNPEVHGDIARAYEFVRSNYDIFCARLANARPAFDWRLKHNLSISLDDIF